MRTMTVTADEFRGALQRAFGSALAEVPEGVRLIADGAQLLFVIEAAPSLRLGALDLARLRVEVRTEAGDEASAHRLLARVDRATQRGGG